MPPSTRPSTGPTADVTRTSDRSPPVVETVTGASIGTSAESEKLVVSRHAFKNALPPVLTLAGLQLGGLLGGSIILERIMGLPGLGVWALDAIQLKDYPIVMIVALYSAATLMVISLLIDVSYGMIDPRIRYS